jgi:hypothetical protein
LKLSKKIHYFWLWQALRNNGPAIKIGLCEYHVNVFYVADISSGCNVAFKGGVAFVPSWRAPKSDWPRGRKRRGLGITTVKGAL